LRAGRQAARLAGRAEPWGQQLNAAQGDDGRAGDGDGKRGEIVDSNMKVITTKAIYTSRMKELLVPPKVQTKFLTKKLCIRDSRVKF
jgi:hypothetical protein